MFPKERQDFIEKSIKEHNSIKVNKIAEHFNVSESTIRRDLQEMEKMKLLVRTHGGAVSINKRNFEPSFMEKGSENQEEKDYIGEIAASMIKEGDTIILDSGTTTLQIAKKIKVNNVTVVTNSIDVAYELSTKESINVIVIGGELRERTRAMVGHLSVDALKGFKVDKAFIGVNGISIEDGISTPNIVESRTKKAMVESANEVILVADSTKFTNVSFSIVCPIEDVDKIVTTRKSNQYDLNRYKELGIEIII